ncbi:MAG: TldD/PmbA family protein [Spirochaetales bacterium]|nr:TldD/PmbA family protein [Spirochaetales bacterium]
MKGRAAGELALDALKRAGSEKSVVNVRIGEVKELNIEGSKLTLLRSTFNTSIGLTALTESRKGSISINKLDADSIRAAAEETVIMAGSSEPDPANEISEMQAPAEFTCGIDAPDLNLMYDRLREFLNHLEEEFPYTILEQGILKFVTGESWFLNSNGVDFKTKRGHYEFESLFSTKKNGKSSSFNNTGYSTDNLDVPIWERGSVEVLLRQNAEQVDTISVPQKFEGDIIVTPDALMSLLGFLTGSISDIPLITGTSAYNDKLGKKIASNVLTLRSSPLAKELVENYFVTGDGYPAADCTVVDKGVLAAFLLSLYGSRKTGGRRSLSSGGCYIVEPGGDSFTELVKSVRKGLLVCRVSGGHPGNNGDFSAVAKNSYYVKDGEITKPLAETMISGNVVAMLQEIGGVSRERVNFGNALLPWISFGGVTVSGK